MNADVDLIGTVIADYSLGRHRGLTDEETQERAERALSWLVEWVESLQAQLAAKETTLNGTYISIEAHEREVKKLKAEIGYEQDRIDCRNPVCNGNREGMYRKCAELEELLEAAIAGQEKLAESQCRERAARLEVCRRCPDGEIIDGVKHYSCDGCKWRGPQDGE